MNHNTEQELVNAADTVKKTSGFWKELGSWILYFLFVIAITYLIITFVGQRTKVDGHSMEPALSNGDNLIVDKLSFRFRDPQRYEVIVFPYQHAENTYYIKRIIGLPGETVQVKDGAVYINGEQLDEHFGAEPMVNAGIAAEPITLGEDEYFVLGDNRNNSSDSRDPDVAAVSKSRIRGNVWIRLRPDFGLIK